MLMISTEIRLRDDETALFINRIGKYEMDTGLLIVLATDKYGFFEIYQDLAYLLCGHLLPGIMETEIIKGV